MNKVWKLKEKRVKAWEAAKAFLDSRRGEDGLLSAEDTDAHEKIGQEVVDLERRLSGWSGRRRLTQS